MNCPHCSKEIDNKTISKALASKGGSRSRRAIDPEAQAKMQEGRKEGRKEAARRKAGHLTRNLLGDGRRKIFPNPEFETHGRSVEVTLGTIRRIIDAFNSKGTSLHTGQASTMWILEEYCMLNGIDYVVESETSDDSSFIGHEIRKQNKT